MPLENLYSGEFSEVDEAPFARPGYEFGEDDERLPADFPEDVWEDPSGETMDYSDDMQEGNEDFPEDSEYLLQDEADDAPLFPEDYDDDSDLGAMGWLRDINPNYDPWDVDSPYNVNCGTCALAVFKRLEGDDSAVASDHTLSDPEMEEQLNMDLVSMPPDDIAKYLMAQGPGAHAVIGVDRFEGPGHWFNAYYDGERVYALDGQTGEMQPWPPDYGDVSNWEVSVKREVG